MPQAKFIKSTRKLFLCEKNINGGGKKKRLQKRDEQKLFSQMNKLDKYFVK